MNAANSICLLIQNCLDKVHKGPFFLSGIFDLKSEEISHTLENASVFAIPFRIPLEVTLFRHFETIISGKYGNATISGSLMVQEGCDQETNCQANFDKCSSRRGANCLDIPFMLGSTLRQITIFTHKTSYVRGETGKRHLAFNQKQVSRDAKRESNRLCGLATYKTSSPQPNPFQKNISFFSRDK